MHEICVERYVEWNADKWRVGCAQCDVLVDNLDRYGAERLRKQLAASRCSPTNLGRTLDRVAGRPSDEAVLADRRTIALWTERAVKSPREEPDIEVTAVKRDVSG